MPVSFTLNGKPVSVDIAPETPLLWVVRDEMRLTGSKFGCGVAQCGACTMEVDGYAQRTCVLPIEAVEGSEVTTIEGVSGKEAEAIQAAWREIDVPQCGYCQSGQIMSAVGLLKDNPSPTDQDIDDAMAGNICRCASYHRIRQAIHSAAETMKG